MQHLEPVGWWHQAHSFVRGHWRDTASSSPMLLAKSCHDIDWLLYLVGDDVRRVSSFGGWRISGRSPNRPGPAIAAWTARWSTTVPTRRRGSIGTPGRAGRSPS
ncbi:Gfo/Idh/MocA family oxidoreductase [Paractinoplanes durhamensis]|uniref:hypothetical protein n=1 Tax=Paractinoplanes durhamensis TaxID=113563 RepID=UPI00363A3FBF